jgi:hypothetical protein
VVYRLEGNRLVEHTLEYPDVFARTAPGLRDYARDNEDAKCWESAGEAYEIAGNKTEAANAYENAERGYLQMLREHPARKGFRQMADHVRARRERLQADRRGGRDR